MPLHFIEASEREEFLFKWKRNASDHDSRRFFLENFHKNFPFHLPSKYFQKSPRFFSLYKYVLILNWH